MGYQNKYDTKYIVLEVVFGILLGVVFTIIAWNNDSLLGKTIADGVIRFYGGLSLIFLFSTLLVGIIGAVKQKQNDRITRAITYSIVFWVLSILISAVVASFLVMASFFIILAATILGFNLGLRHS